MGGLRLYFLKSAKEVKKIKPLCLTVETGCGLISSTLPSHRSPVPRALSLPSLRSSAPAERRYRPSRSQVISVGRGGALCPSRDRRRPAVDPSTMEKGVSQSGVCTWSWGRWPVSEGERGPPAPESLGSPEPRSWYR